MDRKTMRATAIKVTDGDNEPTYFVWDDELSRYLKLYDRSIPKGMREYIEEDDLGYYREYHKIEIEELY